MFAELPPFSRPSKYRPYGFDREFERPVLAHDDLNNGNVPAISAAYGEAAVALIRADPGAYLRTVGKGYTRFCGPSSRYMHVKQRARKMRAHERTYTEILTLAGLADPIGSVYFIFIPGLFLAVLVTAARRWGASPARWAAGLRADPATAFGWLLVVYTTLIGCFFEFGENERFKFMIEPLLLVLAIALIYRFFRKAQHPEQGR
jgi:hypothetical protein